MPVWFLVLLILALAWLLYETKFFAIRLETGEGKEVASKERKTEYFKIKNAGKIAYIQQS